MSIGQVSPRSDVVLRILPLGGVGDIGKNLTIFELGDEIVVIVASASPLFQDELPDTSTSRDYLTSFRKSFLVKPKGGGGNRTVSVIALPIKTQARQ